MSSTSLLDAIVVVKENERVAMESYANAASAISNPVGKELFNQLSHFEKYHFERLSALEKSLQDKTSFIDYEGKEFPLPPLFEIKAAAEPNKKSVMTIISQAIDLEKNAEKAYADLAASISDPHGHKMFTRLAEEEYVHYRILSEAYWTLNELNIWKWTRPVVSTDLSV